MTVYLLEDYGAFNSLEINERMANPMGFSPESQILGPLSNLSSEIACARYQSTPENALHVAWYQKLVFNSNLDGHCKALAKVKLAPGEKLELVRHLPGWNLLKEVFVTAGCNSHAMLTDVEIVEYNDPTVVVHTVATGLDLTTDVCEHLSVGAGLGDFIKRDNSYLLKVSITPPFTDKDGNGVFVLGEGTPCEQTACLNINVHAHMLNSCFRESAIGCRLGGGKCNCDCNQPAPSLCPDDAYYKASTPTKKVAKEV